MKRRRFLAGTGIVAGTALAGCLGGKAAPPRRSEVVDQLQVQENTLTVDLSDAPSVESTRDFGGDVEPAVADLDPVGVAAAAKGGGGGGRGATGRASGGWGNAPKTNKGRAKWHGGSYVSNWRDDNEDDVERYDARIAAVGFAFLGTEEQFEDDKPGAGPVPWDRTVEDPQDQPQFTIDREGWHRVGTKLEKKQGSGDFGWEAIDFKADSTTNGFEVEKQWKVSPRL